MTRSNCTHLSLNIVYLDNDDGIVQLEICKKCANINAICEHVKNKWVYTRNQVNPEEQKLICQLCGADGT